MEAEYVALRTEMVAWQSRRFAILATSISITIGLLGLDGVLKGGTDVSWGVVTSLLWFFIGSVSGLTWYASMANAKLAAYISIFHEEQHQGWESRLLHLKNKGVDALSLNHMILLIYVGLSILSLVIPLAVRSYLPPDKLDILFIVPSGVWLLFCLYLLTVKPPRDDYKKQWLRFKTD